MKIAKTLLIAIAALLLLAVGAAVFIAATFDPNRYKPEITALIKERTGRTLSVEGKLGLSFFPSVGVAAGKTTLSEPNSQKAFAKFGEARMAVALLPLVRGEVVADRITLSGLALDLVKFRNGKTNFDDLIGAGPRTEGSSSGGATVKWDVQGIDIRASSVDWRDESAGTHVTVQIRELKTGRIASGVPGKLDLAAAVQGAKPKINLQVQLGAGYRMDFEKRTVYLSGIVLQVSGDLLGTPSAQKILKISLSGGAQADLEKSRASAEVTAKLDESTLRAKLALANFASPAMQFDLAVDRLNVDRYFPPKKQDAKAGAPEQPIDLSGLRAIEATGTVRVGQLTVSNVKAEKIQVGIRAKGGTIDLSPLSAALYQGTMSGSARVSAASNRFALKQSLCGISVGPLLRDLANRDVLEGRGNLTLDVQGAGNTVSAIRKTLSGNAGLNLKDGAIKGINLADIARSARSLVGTRSTEQGLSSTYKTDFPESSASFFTNNGIAVNEDLDAKSPFIRLRGEGSINLGASSMDYLAKPTLAATYTGQGGREAKDVAGITVPVRISGPLDALKYRPDFSAIAQEAVKSKIGTQVEQTGARAVQQVKDRLKGLLGR